MIDTLHIQLTINNYILYTCDQNRIQRRNVLNKLIEFLTLLTITFILDNVVHRISRKIYN